jgi:hypothetical protein
MHKIATTAPALGLAFALSSLPVAATAQTYTEGTQLSVDGQTLPRCYTPNGNAVTFFLTESDTTPGPYAYSVANSSDTLSTESGTPKTSRSYIVQLIRALTLADNSIPQTPGDYIIIPQSFTQQSAALINFTIAHECAHHTLGHAQMLRDNWRTTSVDWIIESERAADCHAAKSLISDFGYNRDQAAEIIRTAFDAPLVKSHDESDRRAATHDDSATRKSHALACLYP